MRLLARAVLSLAFACSLTLPTRVSAQAVYGSIAGVVVDPTGTAVAGAKVFAAAVTDCFAKPELVAQAKHTFREELGGVEYKPMLPPEQKPPVELNRAIMEKFRPAMAKLYLKELPEFV